MTDAPAPSPGVTGTEIRRALAEEPDWSVPALRILRKAFTARLETTPPDTVLALARELLAARDVPRWFVYELVHHHPGTIAVLDAAALRSLGEGMAAWGEVDPFAALVAGPAWREGRVSDDEIHAWARSPDRWWRRAAVVSTVALNSTARGGDGDTERTLAVCDLLREDRDDLVVKALSWALRELSKKDPLAVSRYLDRNRDALPARVLREVTAKLETGLENPRRERG